MQIALLQENQKTAYDEVKGYFADEKLLKETMAADGKYLKETEKESGSMVTREYVITGDIKWFEDRKDWEKPGSIGYERKTITRTETDDTVTEERYFLCSIKPDAELFSIVTRRHWKIENNLHRALDIVFREDILRSKKKNGIHNPGLIRRFVLFIIKLLEAYYHRSMKRIRSKIGRNLESECCASVQILYLRIIITNKSGAILCNESRYWHF